MGSKGDHLMVPAELLNVSLFGQSRGTCGEFCLMAAKAILSGVVREKDDKIRQAVTDLIANPQIARDYSTLAAIAIEQLGMPASLHSMDEIESVGRLGLVRLSWSAYGHPTQVVGGHRGNFFYDSEHFVLVISVTAEEVQFWEPSFGFGIHPTNRNLDSDREWLGSGTPIWKMPRKEFTQRNLTLPYMKSARRCFVALGGENSG